MRRRGAKLGVFTRFRTCGHAAIDITHLRTNGYGFHGSQIPGDLLCADWVLIVCGLGAYCVRIVCGLGADWVFFGCGLPRWPESLEACVALTALR